MVRRLTARHTITIPSKNLDNIGANEGTYFEVSDDGTSIVLTPKQIEDRLNDEEWAKLDSLRTGKGKTYAKASQAKAHVRRLSK